MLSKQSSFGTVTEHSTPISSSRRTLLGRVAAISAGLFGFVVSPGKVIAHSPGTALSIPKTANLCGRSKL
ncbi:MAG TPA: hypothetical protein VGD54_17590, partial [Steroidobacteraceae bacterium]